MSSLDPFIGKVVAGFQLEQLLGEGGMGRVYLATQVRLKRHVAVKILPTQMVFKNKQFVDRFLREALTAAQLTHPNIVQVYDAGEFEGIFYIAMELVDGQGLDDILKESKILPIDHAIDIIVQAARGLAAAQKKNLVHRDIKPGNLMITSEGIVKVADFGLAKNTEASHGLTEAGQVLGTPAFMSPEQGKGLPADHRSDLYSLGVTLFALVTGSLPFQGETPVSIMLKHISEPPPDPCEINASIPGELGDLILKVMEKEPEERFQSAEEFIAALEVVRAAIPGARMTLAASGTITGLKTGENLDSAETLTDFEEFRSSPRRTQLKPPSSTSATLSAPGRRSTGLLAVAIAVPLSVAAVLIALYFLGLFDKTGPGGSGPGIEEGKATPPATLLFRVLEPAPDSVLAESTVVVTGVIDSGKIRGIRINGEEAVIRGKDFTAEVVFQDGKRSIHVLVKGSEGGEQEVLVPVVIDTTPPAIEIPGLPPEPPAVRAGTATVNAIVRDENLKTVTLNGEAVLLKPGGALTAEVPLAEGLNEVVLEAVDAAGHRASARLAFLQDSVKPVLTLGALPTSLEDSDPKLALTGRANEVLAELRINGEIVGRGCTEFSHEIELSPGENGFLFSAVDRAGNVSEKSLSVSFTRLPPGLKPGKEKNTYVWQADGAVMVKVPAGAFRLGGGSRPEENPQHEATLPEFFIDALEVTNAKYSLFLEAVKAGAVGDVFHPDDPDRDPTPRFFGDQAFSAPDQPVAGVDWFDAWAYAKWAGKTLPTEAQWEKAAGFDPASGASRRFVWGEQPPEKGFSNFGRTRTAPAPAGTFPRDRSALGCLDMAGNVSEWCLDWFLPDFYSLPGASKPSPLAAEPGERKARAVRGGSFRDVPDWLRNQSRRGAPPVWSRDALQSFGFRTVLEPR